MSSILVIRLGAMGDILHALPAVASLRRSFPGKRLRWLVARRWMPLLEGNPAIDELIAFERGDARSVFEGWRRIRAIEPELAIDFQGLLQSAIAGRISRPKRYLGFDREVAREPLASVLYGERVHVTGPHRVQRNLQLVEAAGAWRRTEEAWVPAGREEGILPKGEFVLASPFAGWGSKQWPLTRYDELGARVAREGLPLVVNVPDERARQVAGLKHVAVHVSGLPGLIDATRRALAVVGVDSGPLHLAAALRKPGAALFGPTDPAQTGPYGGSMAVLRTQDAETTYKRSQPVALSMSDLGVEQVWEALAHSLRARVI